MIKSLFRDIIQTVFGFFIAFKTILKNPLKTHELAIKPNGFRLGMSAFVWVLVFDIWIGKTILSDMENYFYSETDNQELLLDYGDDAESDESMVYRFASSPLIKEMIVFTRLIIAVLATIPAAFLIMGRDKNETIFRNFVGLNLLLSSFTALISLLMIGVVFKIVLATASLNLITNFHFIQYLILGILSLPMIFVFYINWKKMMPNTRLWRINLAYFVWLFCGLIVSGIYKLITGT